jgi:antitoxin YefM
VDDHHERVMVMVYGRPPCLVSVEDLERLEEAVAVLGDAGTLRRLAGFDGEQARGEEVSADQLAETIRARRSSAA